MNLSNLLALVLSILPAIAQVESDNKADAVGDNGKALGIYQIHRCVIEDVNEYAHTNYKWEDVLNTNIAKQVATLYLKRWGIHYWLITGKEPSQEVLARIWKRGPNGWQDSSTLSYWKKIERRLKYEVP